MSATWFTTTCPRAESTKALTVAQPSGQAGAAFEAAEVFFSVRLAEDYCPVVADGGDDGSQPPPVFGSKVGTPKVASCDKTGKRDEVTPVTRLSAVTYG